MNGAHKLLPCHQPAVNGGPKPLRGKPPEGGWTDCRYRCQNDLPHHLTLDSPRKSGKLLLLNTFRHRTSACRKREHHGFPLPRMLPSKIDQLIANLGLDASDVEPYGWYKGKLALGLEQKLTSRPRGKYVVVSGISPTPLGEGKTVSTIGLAMASVPGRAPGDSDDSPAVAGSGVRHQGGRGGRRPGQSAAVRGHQPAFHRRPARGGGGEQSARRRASTII